ncbi:DUF2690 domain-containing protein [Streptomyces sp. NPDC035033]|uniref:DUF2690 domain-containing protein n=1 Tax=Streptomyces sp. NPDC035033 TaxID=3155368 RepID=UPI0033DE7E5B
MPAWKSLSDELDPDVRTFTERLRLVIDRSGLGVAAVAERTGHGPDAWEAYLNACRPVPRSAVVALSDVTGADLGPLTAQWEHADRAWRRPGHAAPAAPPPESPEPAVRDGVGDAVRDGIQDAVRDGGPGAVRGGIQDAVPDGRRAPEDAPAERTMRIRKAVPPGPGPEPAPGPAPAPRKPRRASPLLYVAGIVGAVLVVIAAVLLADLGGSAPPPAAAPTAPATTSAPAPAPSLPDGVRCTGADCGGRDPEAMGCGGPLATTVALTRVGAALVEVRYSEVCAAAWARITGAAAGDEVSVQAGTAVRVANVPAGGDTDAYTAMIPVGSGGAARACAALTGGEDGCTGE